MLEMAPARACPKPPARVMARDHNPPRYRGREGAGAHPEKDGRAAGHDFRAGLAEVGFKNMASQTLAMMPAGMARRVAITPPPPARTRAGSPVRKSRGPGDVPMAWN